MDDEELTLPWDEPEEPGEGEEEEKATAAETVLTVTEVNIAVNDLYFPGDETAAEPARVE